MPGKVRRNARNADARSSGIADHSAAELKRILSTGAGVFVVGIIIFYAYFQSRAVLEGPQIDIVEPENNITSPTPLLLVRGVATHAKEITLQGRQILIDLDGNFAEYLLLSDGYNIIELTARDAQGKSIKKNLEIVYHAPMSTVEN